MIQTIIVFVIIGLIITGILVNPILVKRRRNLLKRRHFPPLWNAIIENNLPVYLYLSSEQRKRLQGHIQVFLTEKQFIGCGGLQVTEEMKLIIAAVACLLLLNERGQYFSKLRSILVYPSTYIVKEISSIEKYVVIERNVARLGESWVKDKLILSWEQVKQDTLNWHDGRNVVLHEFAHQLDQEDGKAEGVPILGCDSDYLIWSEVMAQAYQKLYYDDYQDRTTVIDSYGATNPAEFFAVVTETFFEKPHQLLSSDAAVYHQLQSYYQLDPVEWNYPHPLK